MRFNLELFTFYGIIFTLCISFLLHTSNAQQTKYNVNQMPRTSFSCRDKILGGYYADPETQCQMFHVCVKIPGIGIQDFRFLCPNGTAFDQEAQICADWGDVDCETATLYYGSDNFDLYRIGASAPKKSPSLAEEDESVFHLQHAETSDARRSKQYIVNQNIYSTSNPVYTQSSVTTTSTTTTSRPITSRPTTTTTKLITTTRPTTTTAPPTTQNVFIPTVNTKKLEVVNREKVQRFDDELQRNVNHHSRVQPIQKTTIKPKQRSRHRGRSKFQNSEYYRHNVNLITDTYQRKSSTPSTTLNHISSNNKNFAQYNDITSSTSTTKSPPFLIINPDENTSSAAYTTPESRRNFEVNKLPNVERASIKLIPQTNNANTQQNFVSKSNAIPQRVIVPNKLNPIIRNNSSNQKSTYHQVFETSTSSQIKLDVTTSTETAVYKGQKFNFKTQKYEPILENAFNQYQQQQQQQVQQQESTPNYQNLNYHAPQNQKVSTNNDRQNGNRFTTEEFAPRRGPKNYAPQQTTENYQKSQQNPQPNSNVQEFEKTIKIQHDQQHTPKKFSTLVPKENYDATTFKPSFPYRKAGEKLQTASKPSTSKPTYFTSPHFSTTTTTAKTTTSDDEDDGQYRPELYEKDFYRNRIKTTRAQYVARPQHTFSNNNNNNGDVQSNSNSGEDELFKTANSQNIAASGNQLRIDKAKQTTKLFKFNDYSPLDFKSSPRPFSKPEATTTIPAVTTTTTFRTTSEPFSSTQKIILKKEDKDDYDYAYYDTHSDSDYNEYPGLIEDFGKTVKRKN